MTSRNGDDPHRRPLKSAYRLLTYDSIQEKTIEIPVQMSITVLECKGLAIWF